MAPKVFITGGTGYIGGNVPEAFSERYPKVKIVRGNFDSFETLSEAAFHADVVVHSNSDHEPSIKALIEGLVKRSQTSYLIHLSGSGLLADWSEPTYLGKLNPKIWSDISDISDITSRPDGQLHRNVDKTIQQAAAQHGDKLRTAIVCPPDIYGPGRGPGRRQSVYVPYFFNAVKQVGAPFYTGEGNNTRSFVHIEDLMSIYLALIEAAVDGGGAADWGIEGYYFAASQEHSQIEVATRTSEILKRHGQREDAETVAVTVDQINATIKHPLFPYAGVYMFAANSRTRADRAAKRLGYAPKEGELWEYLEADLVACMQ